MLEVRALSRPGLAPVDLDLAAGEALALLGPSGSGKTTALNLIGALDRPTSGTVLLEGQDLGALDRQALSRIRRDRIGFVFQAYNLIPVLSARENVEFVMELQGVAAAERSRRALEMLDAVGLAGIEDKRPLEMSGGQQQRV
ncbi:MAG: ATP-binding cassette domain-containing protein, partial [Tritonibacter mobilis]|nr:ATP-binding cassette domain-containing protein [Tritonibacter mobilis]